MTDTLDHTETLWVTDAEMYRRLGLSAKKVGATIRELDRLPSGFPRKEPLWDNRRYWPAIRAYFDRQQDKMTLQTRRTP